MANIKYAASSEATLQARLYWLTALVDAVINVWPTKTPEQQAVIMIGVRKILVSTMHLAKRFTSSL